MTGIDVGSLQDIPGQGARVVKTAFGCVAIFRTADDQVLPWMIAARTRAGR